MLRIHAGGTTALRCVLAVLLAGCASSGSPQASEDERRPRNTSPSAPPADSGTDTETTAAAGYVTGIFTSGQADRGRVAFEKACADCHINSEFRGSTLQDDWGRRTVHSFYRTLRSTMPDDNPGSLGEVTYLDVVSYILSINGHAAGSVELAAGSPMHRVRMAPPDLDP